MKNQVNFQLLAILIGGVLFNLIFWEEELGLNLLLFSIFVVALLLFSPTVAKTKKTTCFLAAHLLAAILVVYNNSDLSIITWILSLIISVGFAHETQIRSIFTAIPAAMWQGLNAPFNFFSALSTLKIGNFSLKPVFRLIKFVVIPFFIVMLFMIIYCNANQDFANYIEIFGTTIGNFFDKTFSFFFSDVDIVRAFHFVFGILVTTAIMMSAKNQFIQKIEIPLTDNMARNRKSKNKKGFFYEMTEIFVGDLLKKKMALKTENVIGIISFSALNLLLLSLNAIDMKKLWFGNGSANLTQDVHDGTSALIFSIIMAMAVILYFFKGNLNFYSKNKIIVALAYAWIIQNVFLIASVFLRDYNYICAYGLTYKKIGVIVFLLLCSIGLFTVYLKVARQKTLFYLFKVNGFSWYGLLIVACFVNWDTAIAKYNIEHAETTSLSMDYLFELSDRALPTIDQNKELLKAYQKSHPVHRTAETLYQGDLINIDNRLTERIESFNKRLNKTSWLSWNYRNWQANEYFETSSISSQQIQKR